MSTPKERIEYFKDNESKEENKITTFYFDVPMYHEDWHKADEMGLVYLGYNHVGPDYWDDEMIFVKKEDEEIGNKWWDYANTW